MNEEKFLACVAQHERQWGEENYKGRPTLKQIMEAKVVAFWHPTGDELPITLTIHKDLREIDAYVKALVWHTKTELPRLRLATVFVSHKEIKIKDVKVVFDRPNK